MLLEDIKWLDREVKPGTSSPQLNLLNLIIPVCQVFSKEYGYQQ